MLDYEWMKIHFGSARQSLMRIHHDKSDQAAVRGALSNIRAYLTDDQIEQHDEEIRPLLRALADLLPLDPAEFDQQTYHLLAICLNSVAEHVTMRFWLGQGRDGQSVG
ncbi:MAG: hypothetical protein ACK4UZ_01355 [Rhizobium rhizophilum]